LFWGDFEDEKGKTGVSSLNSGIFEDEKPVFIKMGQGFIRNRCVKNKKLFISLYVPSGAKYNRKRLAYSADENLDNSIEVRTKP